MMDASGDDALDDNLRDRLVAAGKAVVGMVPWAGGALGEILTAIIPGQRADRIATYLRRLAGRVEELEEGVRATLAEDPGKEVDLIEAGGFQAARALSSARIDQIVEAVMSGLSAEGSEAIRRRRLLTPLGELDEDEVSLLSAYGESWRTDETDVWERVNRPEPAHMGSSQLEIDREQLFEAGKAHLLQLGLLRKRHPFVKRRELPEFDTFAGEFRHTIDISPLGQMLLREIGLEPPDDGDEEVQ